MRIRTGYSFRVAFGHLEEVAARLKEIKWPRQPISDTCSTFGFNRWAKLVPKPLFGVELAVIPAHGVKNTPMDFWTFFAKDSLVALHDLIGEATSAPSKTPVLLYETALKAKGVIKISGHRLLLEHVRPNAKDFFIGLSPSLPLGLYKAANKKGFRFLAVSDNVYPTIKDKETYRVAIGWRAGIQTYPQHILSDKEWHDAVWFANPEVRSTAIKNRNAAFKSCKAKLEKATLFVPKKPKTLRAMCLEGARVKKINMKNNVYAERLERELAMIAEKKFEDYFYIIADIVSWAKKHMVVGPARGSSCGSLVCYLLDITAVDPIKFNLIFERFIDINRADLPDIDIDFSDAQRDKVIDYVEEVYGREHVARLGTVGVFRPRSALNQVGIALRIPKWQTEKVLDSLIVRSLGDSRALQCLEDTLKDTEAGRKLFQEYPQAVIGARLEGHPNNASQHAAGVCVTKEPIDKIVAIDRRSWSAMCDKKDAEDFNMLKIDMLGLTQLSIFERTMSLIGRKPVTGWLETLPLDDQAAFDVLNKHYYSGIFQFNGAALQSLAKQIEVTDIEDIISLTALARPGPMASGQANHWVKRKTGIENISYPHPCFEPYLHETLGVVAYQEQVMQIGREIGDLSWEDVTQLRKSMARSLGKEYFDQYGDRWKAGALKKGIPEFIVDKVWDDLCGYGSWAFNRAHAVAYGLVSYYCAYLKAHYPVEFAAATLDAEVLPARQILILRELQKEGVGYKPVDPLLSEERWTITDTDDGGKQLLGPLTLIKGIGPAFVAEILTARATGTELRGALLKKLENAKTEVDSLFPISNAIEKIDLEKKNIISKPKPIIDCQCGVKGQVVVFGVVTKIAPKDENEAVNVAKRKGKVLTGPTAALNLFIRDDTDEIFAKVNRYDFERIGRKVAEEGRAGKSLYAIKGEIPVGFRMISIDDVKHLGELDADAGTVEQGGYQHNKDKDDLPNTGMD